MTSISPLKLFRGSKEENYRSKISVAMREIDFHLKELDHVKLRLSERRQRLFEHTVKALQDKDSAKATVYANEHTELRKVAKVVETSQLALMQVTLRLQSITDIGDAIAHMNSAFKVMRLVSKTIQGLVPAMDVASQEINSTLTETMAEMGQLNPTLSININTDTSEELIEEARKYAEEQAESVKRDLQIAPARFEEEITRATAVEPLLATAEDAEENSILGVVFSSPGGSEVEEEVFKYAQANDGAVNVASAATALGIPADEVENSMLRLIANGKVKPQSGVKPE